ncbi:hypothetical protein Tco_1030865 [Tanacetum coccineum]|uniref:Reverse transcriptase domain-containing protein n=1 Tax=Tanacetum coccineum TaxID=301880 RepID=A0ABQ5G861_9ASTR
MAMTADKNSDSDSDTEVPPFKKITINTDYKIKTSLEEPPKDLELKPLPDNLEYVFLEEPSFLPVIISSQLSKEKKNKLISVLKKHKQAFAWKTTDIPGICPSFCKHKIQLLDDKKHVVKKQRRLNPKMQEVVKKEIMKLLETGIIYPITDSPWVSPIHCVQKKSGITVVTNENDELVPTRTVTVGEYALINVAFDLLRDALSAIFGLSELKTHYMLTCGRDLGIELLADAAISSLVDDNADHVKDLSLLKEHVNQSVTPPKLGRSGMCFRERYFIIPMHKS